MNIQERTDAINAVIRNIAEFIQVHKDIKDDFNEYLRTIGQGPQNGAAFEAACFRRLQKYS